MPGPFPQPGALSGLASTLGKGYDWLTKPTQPTQDDLSFMQQVGIDPSKSMQGALPMPGDALGGLKNLSSGMLRGFGAAPEQIPAAASQLISGVEEVPWGRSAAALAGAPKPPVR